MSVSGNLREMKSGNLNKKNESIKKAAGVYRRKSGKFAAKIHDRIRKKDLWLGTFDTWQEASKVCWDKKKELDKELEGFSRRVITDGKRTAKFVGVSRRSNGQIIAHIRDPIRKKKLYLGSFESEDEAAEAYLAKKAELEEEVKGKGIKWIWKRECRRSMLSEITKNVVECVEGNSSDRSLVNLPIDIDDSDYDSVNASTLVCQENSPCLDDNQESPCFEDDQEPWNEIGNLGSCNGGSSNAVPDEKLPAAEEKNDYQFSGNQKSSSEVDSSDPSHKKSTLMDSGVSEENTPIQKDGGSTEEELIVIDSCAASLVNTGSQILLRTKSGTPLMDSNGFLLGKWSWIDDLSLPSDM